MKILSIAVLCFVLYSATQAPKYNKPKFKSFESWKSNYRIELGKLDIKHSDIILIRFNHRMQDSDLDYLKSAVTILRNSGYKNFLLFLSPGYDVETLSGDYMEEILFKYAKIKGWKIRK